jgi:glycerophosphoryl diester phosphodiesterase
LYIYPQTFEDGFNAALQNGYKGMSISTDVISAEQVDQAHANGIFVTIWGASTKKKNAEAIRKNPDMIETDKVEDLITLLQ